MEIDKKLFTLCLVLIFILSAMLGAQYVTNRKIDQKVDTFVENVRNSENDEQVLSLADEFISGYQSTQVSLSNSNAGRLWVKGTRATPMPSNSPTKQPPIIYPTDCESVGSAPCISSVNPSFVNADEIGKVVIEVKGRGFDVNSTLVYLCKEGSPKCDGAISASGDDISKGYLVSDSTTLSFILPKSLEPYCTDEACLGGLRAVPVSSGQYYIQVVTRSGESNKLPLLIGK